MAQEVEQVGQWLVTRRLLDRSLTPPPSADLPLSKPPYPNCSLALHGWDHRQCVNVCINGPLVRKVLYKCSPFTIYHLLVKQHKENGSGLLGHNISVAPLIHVPAQCQVYHKRSDPLHLGEGCGLFSICLPPAHLLWGQVLRAWGKLHASSFWRRTGKFIEMSGVLGPSTGCLGETRATVVSAKPQGEIGGRI